MKACGIGMHKTGTTTLGQCFQILGFKHISYDLNLLRAVRRRELGPALAAARHYDSCEDWPWPLLYRQLDEAFPQAKFILTVRKDPETWLRSLLAHARRTGPAEARELVYGFAMPQGHEQAHLDYYRAHNQAVQDYFRDRPSKLLVVCWETGSGWTELAEFLELPVPDRPLPHANRAARAWRRRWRRRFRAWLGAGED